MKSDKHILGLMKNLAWFDNKVPKIFIFIFLHLEIKVMIFYN
jgi:hypothetical protein